MTPDNRGSDGEHRLNLLEMKVGQHAGVISRVDAALFGSDQRSGLISEVAKIGVMLKLGIWLVAIIGGATLTTLVKMMLDNSLTG